MKSFEVIHVTIAFDKAYLTPFYVLITSIFVNNKNNNIHIHVIAKGVNEDNINDIINYVKKNNATISFYDIDDNFSKGLKINASWSEAIYYRFMFPYLLPNNVDKYIYLDTDIVIIGDLMEFYKVDVDKHPLAAVCDGKNMSKSINENTYFNSGVLLVNKCLWIEQDITKISINYIRDNIEKIVFPDQDALNAVLRNNWKMLDSRFNLVTGAIPNDIKKKDFKKYLYDKIVIHYTSALKPWSIMCENRFRYLYFEYLRESPVVYKNKYHDSKLRFKYPKVYIKIRLKEIYLNYIGPIK